MLIDFVDSRLVVGCCDSDQSLFLLFEGGKMRSTKDGGAVRFDVHSFFPFFPGSGGLNEKSDVRPVVVLTASMCVSLTPWTMTVIIVDYNAKKRIAYGIHHRIHCDRKNISYWTQYNFDNVIFCVDRGVATCVCAACACRSHS